MRARREGRGRGWKPITFYLILRTCIVVSPFFFPELCFVPVFVNSLFERVHDLLKCHSVMFC